MENIYEILVAAVLFFILSPGVLPFTLPDSLIGAQTNPYIQAAIHSIVYTAVLFLLTIYLPSM